MDPDNGTSQGNGDQSTKRVLEYYQKFSQNRDLPKYFSGSSVSYLPEIKVTDIGPSGYNPKDNIIITTNVDIVVTPVSDKDDDEKNQDNSRASSAMSNRKLEWDNGADIGYDNCSKASVLFKSSSLPVLSEVKDKKIEFNLPKTDSNVKVLVFNYSSDDSSHVKSIQSSTSSSPAPNEPIFSSSTSASLENKQIPSTATSKASEEPKMSSSSSTTSESKVTSFATTLLYLKQKIGAPDAHSTPRIIEGQKSDSELISKTPSTKKKIKKTRFKEAKSEPTSTENVKPSTSMHNIQIDPTNIKEAIIESKKKVEIFCEEIIKKKVVNLVLTKPITVECMCEVKAPKNKTIQTVINLNNVAVQTDIIPLSEIENLIPKHVNSNQSFMCIEHSEDDIKTTCCTQTESDVIASNCDSFEYIKNTESVPSQDKVIPQPEETALPGYDEGRLKRSQRRTDLNVVATSSESINHNLYECQAAFTQEVEKSVELLHKLLQSKNYDSRTKKKYMKKIIQKITNSKFLEESSTSSELFYPKKTKSEFMKPVRIDSTDSSDPKSGKNWLESNLPWYPTREPPKSSKYKQLHVKTFSEEIRPTQAVKSSESSSSQPEIIPIDSRQCRPKQFTLTNNEFAVNHPTKSSSRDDSTSLEKQCDSSSSKCYDNWREDKTTSEKLHEAKSSSNNYLVDIAKKEKQYQITWINNEINHLSKLKNLLEKDGTQRKRTTVYKVQNDKDEGRNYVIETNLGARPSNNINFNLDGKKYSVEEVDKAGTSAPVRVAGDIDVSIHDKVTNIRVKTFCEKCKHTPCACPKKPVKDLDLSHSICLHCRKANCVCQNREINGDPRPDYAGTFIPVASSSTFPQKSQKFKEPLREFKTFCSSCGTWPCICVDHRTVTSSELLGENQDAYYAPKLKKADEQLKESEKVCATCEMWPCVCINRRTVTSSEIIRDYQALNDGRDFNNSLRRVFENCKCNTQEHCKCNFVEKLLRHFNVAPNLAKSHENLQNMQIQTENIEKEFQQLATQTDYNRVQHTGVQADKQAMKTISSQTSRQYLYPTMDEQIQGIIIENKENKVQTYSEPMRSVPSQISREYLDDNCQTIPGTTKCKSSQICRDNLIANKGIQENAENKNTNVQTSSLETKNAKLQTARSTKAPFDSKDIGFNADNIPTHHNIVQTERNTVDRNLQAKLNALAVKTQTVCDIVCTQTQVGKNLEECPSQTVKNQQFDQHVETLSPQDSLTQTYQREGRESTFSQTERNKPKHISSQTNDDIKEQRVGPYKAEQSALKDASTQAVKKAMQRRGESTNTECDCICKKTRSSGPQYRSSKDHSSQSEAIKIPLNMDESQYIEAATTCSYAGIGNVRNADLQTDKKDTRDKGIQGRKGKNKAKNNEIAEEKYTRSPSTQNGTSSTSETSTVTNSDKTSIESGYVYVKCMCCKERTPSQSATALQSTNQTYHLCQHCFQRRPIVTSVCYTSPQHVCRCYERMRHHGQYCSCTRPSRMQDSRYCGYCRYKLKKTVKSSGGIAYTLTLENASPNHSGTNEKKKNRAKLQEIKIKVPTNRKKYKDKENYQRKGSESDNIKRPSASENSSDKGDQKQYTLQEYLNENRPDFVDSAEYRRNVVQSAREQREENTEKGKLKFLEENAKKDPPEKSYKLFSEKEMKEITRRNYKMLPEVQGQLHKKNEKRLRDADKAIKDVFTKKVQKNVLKGKRNFPINTNIVHLPS